MNAYSERRRLRARLHDRLACLYNFIYDFFLLRTSYVRLTIITVVVVVVAVVAGADVIIRLRFGRRKTDSDILLLVVGAGAWIRAKSALCVLHRNAHTNTSIA